MAPVLTRQRPPIVYAVHDSMILGPADPVDPPTKVDGTVTRKINNNVGGACSRAPAKITGGNWEISAADMRDLDPVVWDAIACGLL